MREQGREVAQRKKGRGVFDFLKNRGKAWLLVAGVIVGALLLLVGAGVGDGGEHAAEAVAAAESETAADLVAYKKIMEKELENLCNAVSGVSGAEVLVTLECGYRRIYATDHSGDPVTVGNGSSERAMVVGLKPPAISGVAVVCRGGNDPGVQRRLTDVIATGLGITSNRVFVTGK